MKIKNKNEYYFTKIFICSCLVVSVYAATPFSHRTNFYQPLSHRTNSVQPFSPRHIQNNIRPFNNFRPNQMTNGIFGRQIQPPKGTMFVGHIQPPKGTGFVGQRPPPGNTGFVGQRPPPTGNTRFSGQMPQPPPPTDTKFDEQMMRSKRNFGIYNKTIASNTKQTKFNNHELNRSQQISPHVPVVLNQPNLKANNKSVTGNVGTIPRVLNRTSFNTNNKTLSGKLSAMPVLLNHTKLNVNNRTLNQTKLNNNNKMLNNTNFNTKNKSLPGILSAIPALLKHIKLNGNNKTLNGKSAHNTSGMNTFVKALQYPNEILYTVDYGTRSNKGSSLQSFQGIIKISIICCLIPISITYAVISGV